MRGQISITGAEAMRSDNTEEGSTAGPVGLAVLLAGLLVVLSGCVRLPAQVAHELTPASTSEVNHFRLTPGVLADDTGASVQKP